MKKLISIKALESFICVAALTTALAVPAFATDGTPVVKNTICSVEDNTVTGDTQTDRVIVKFKDGVSVVKQKQINNKHAKGRSEKVDNGIYTIDTVTESESEVTNIVNVYNNDSSVEYAEPDYVAHAFSVTPNDSYYGRYQAGYLTTMGVQGAWETTKGSSDIVVAVLDTGVSSTHPDLAGRLVSGYDFVNNDSDPSDDNGHGTMVSGIIAANTNNGTGIAGADWNCKIMPVKVLDADGDGYVSDMAEGITYAVDHGANVINMSLGCESDSQTLQDAVNYAYEHNVLVVASTGNSNNAVKYPAADEHVLAVGSVGSDKVRSSISCYGEQIDVVAVGDNVVSTYINGTTNSYGLGSGTSFAAPYVTGLVSLMLSENSQLTPDEITTDIEETATDLGDSGWDQYYGYGLISYTSALNAVNNLDKEPPVIKLNGDESVSVTRGTKYTDLGATAYDKVDGDITSSIKAYSTVNTSVSGSYSVAYSVSDKAGNTATATRTVKVVSNNVPIITLVGSSSVNVACGQSYDELGATAYDTEDGDITGNIVTTGDVNTSVPGTYQVRYNVEDSQGASAVTVTRTITVKNNAANTAPVLKIVGSTSISMVCGYTYTEEGATAYDAEDGDLTAEVVIDGTVDSNTPGLYNITYNVTDSQGLAAKTLTRSVLVFQPEQKKPNTRPVVTLNGSSYKLIAFNTPYEELGATAYDAEDGDLTDNIVLTGSVDPSKSGVYNIVYSVTDSDGNLASVTRVISVQGNCRPKITVNSGVCIFLKHGEELTVPTATAYDAEDGDVSDLIVVSGVDLIDTSKPGFYQIRYDVTDRSGLAGAPAFVSVSIN